MNNFTTEKLLIVGLKYAEKVYQLNAELENDLFELLQKELSDEYERMVNSFSILGQMPKPAENDSKMQPYQSPFLFLPKS